MGAILYIIAALFFIAWLLAFVAFHVTNGLLHLLLVGAVIAIIIRVIQGRNS